MQPYLLLIECIAALPDPRKTRRKRRPLVAMIALAVAGTLCGSTTVRLCP